MSAFCEVARISSPSPTAEEPPDRHGDHDAGGGKEEAVDRERLVEQEDHARAAG
jgi:hypothetical protein